MIVKNMKKRNKTQQKADSNRKQLNINDLTNIQSVYYQNTQTSEKTEMVNKQTNCNNYPRPTQYIVYYLKTYQHNNKQ